MRSTEWRTVFYFVSHINICEHNFLQATTRYAVVRLDLTIVYPDSNVIVDYLWPTTECHQLRMVAHHTDVQLIAAGPLATLFAGGGPQVGHQWQIRPSNCRGVPLVVHR